jgi:hypothetical protein
MLAFFRAPLVKKRNVLLEMVLSITSAAMNHHPEIQLISILILRAGSTKTSQRRCSAFNSLGKKTSILAPVFPYSRTNVLENF